jgi:hypothetical protein
MLGLEQLAEQRIIEAIAQGQLSNLPGAGQPLALDDDPLLPEDLRVAYRILKNAGYAPTQIEQLKRIAELERWVSESTEDEHRRKAVTRLNMLRASLQTHRIGNPWLDEQRYHARLIERLERATDSR